MTRAYAYPHVNVVRLARRTCATKHTRLPCNSTVAGSRRRLQAVVLSSRTRPPQTSRVARNWCPRRGQWRADRCVCREHAGSVKTKILKKPAASTVVSKKPTAAVTKRPAAAAKKKPAAAHPQLTPPNQIVVDSFVYRGTRCWCVGSLVKGRTSTRSDTTSSA